VCNVLPRCSTKYPSAKRREVSVGIGVKWSQAERIVVCVLNSVRLMVHLCCVSINF
jgi:hypothetical protein